jgi:hypothetical protein
LEEKTKELGKVDVDGREILKGNLDKQCVKMLREFSWLK